MAASRRGVLGGVAVLLGAAATPAKAATAPNTDAELIAACGTFEALEWRYLGLFYGAGRIEDEAERTALIPPIHNEQDDLADRIAAMRATTPEGFRALARAVIIWAPEELEPSEYHAEHDDLRNHLLRNLAGEEWLAKVFATLGRPERTTIARQEARPDHAGEGAR